MPPGVAIVAYHCGQHTRVGRRQYIYQFLKIRIWRKKIAKNRKRRRIAWGRRRTVYVGMEVSDVFDLRVMGVSDPDQKNPFQLFLLLPPLPSPRKGFFSGFLAIAPVPMDPIYETWTPCTKVRHTATNMVVPLFEYPITVFH